MKVKTLKQMLESVPDDYDLTVIPVGELNEKESSRVTGINVQHRNYSTEGCVNFRYTDPAPQNREAAEAQNAANTIIQFVNQIVDAYLSGFTPYPHCTLQQLHRVAQHHVKDSYGIESKEFSQEFGAEIFKECLEISKRWDAAREVKS